MARGGASARAVLVLWGALGTSACGAARPPPARCLVDVPKTRLQNVRVVASGMDFSVGLDDAASRIELSEAQPDARIDVRAPLRFSGTYPRRQLPLRVARAVDAFGGRLRLGEGAVPEWGEVRAGAVLASVEASLNVELQEPLEIPCANLGLRAVEAHASPPLELSSGERRGLAEGFVPLYLEPRRSDALHVRTRGAFAVRAHEGDWVLLEAAWGDGSMLRGWTLASSTTAAAEELGGVGAPWSGNAPCGSTDAPRLIRLSLRAGAAIAAEPGGLVWAHLTQDVDATAYPNPGADEWVRVAALPGLLVDTCSRSEHVWVHVRDVVTSRAP